MKVQQSIKVLAAVLGFIGFLVTVFFAQRYDANEKVKTFSVNINQLEGDAFLDEADIKSIVRSKVDSLVGKPKHKVNLNEIESLVNKLPAVEHAEVFMDVAGHLQIDLRLRKVLVRIKPNGSQGYYIDEHGKKMMWVSSYTPRVMVINGYLHNYDSLLKPELSIAERQNLLFNDAYAFAKVVEGDSLWSSQITQVYVNAEGDAELKTLIGDQKIVLGSLQEANEKLEKLRLYYQEVVRKVGWTKYEEVSLKYRDQIVCK